MAKGNMFLGMARGKVGDVVFYRADGQQLSRVRNRNPRNPQSVAQMRQRAIAATITLAYKVGRAIFDHSFEGKSVPAGSQRAFLSANIRMLRESVLNEMDKQPAASGARVVSPSSAYPVPTRLRISEGSLINNVYGVTEPDALTAITLVEPNENETIANYFQRLSISEGDIFTFVGFGVDSVSGGPYAATDLVSPRTRFGWVRLIAKDVSSLNTPVIDTLLSSAFDITTSGPRIPSGKLVLEGIALAEITGSGQGSLGVIRSRDDSGLRSTSDCLTNFDLGGTNAWGVAPAAIARSWSQEVSVSDSPLILEGGSGL